MSFINEDFMLTTKTAKKLFYDYAKDLPIIDYHCHLVPEKIANNYQFKNVADLMLGGDHYKWRQMRTLGVDEKYTTGDATDYEKWEKWAETLPMAIGNPLFHWTQLELKRYFDVDEILTPDTAKAVWDKCNARLETEDYRAKGLIEMSGVEALCTTDDPADDLIYHKQIRESGFKTKVLPTMRPDKAVEIGKETFLPYIEAIGVKDYDSLKKWLVEKIAFFNSMGCKLSDHALEYVPFKTGDAKAVFEKRLNGGEITRDEEEIYKTDILSLCASEYVKLGWTMQLHIGALRNNNTRMYNILGADVGFDSINDLCIAEKLSGFLNNLELKEILPKTILYVLNPKDNYVIGTMLGNFQKGPYRGKIQFGSGWWFNDQRDGMREQMKALANLGLLSTFVGMLTDSRSFISYTRHEYFRRIMCSLIGEWVEAGEYPCDMKLLKKIVEGISYYNAKEYLEL
ncbi:MAG: glucuronate isomerase [Ruminococcaceae bacterium]|nr:glucuronate isomerase [Oscillospiraceae bacterium]